MARVGVATLGMVAAAASLAACSHISAETEGPAGLAYACADGHRLAIRYDRGDPNRMPASLAVDGREQALRPAPAQSGLRYEGEDGLVWTAEGDEALLKSFDGTEVRCTRVRGGERPD